MLGRLIPEILLQKEYKAGKRNKESQRFWE